MKVKITVAPGASAPAYATEGSAGLDLCANEDTVLNPYVPKAIQTGLALAIPQGHVGLICPRSGMSMRGVTVMNAPGIVDEDYRGEIKVILIFIPLGGYANAEPSRIRKGDRIAQLIISKIERVELDPVLFLSETARGSGGFGHTGV